MKDECTREDLVQERLMTEHWGVRDDGDLDISDFRGDGGSSEFNSYACSECGEYFKAWGMALEHVGVTADDTDAVRGEL